MKIAPSPPMHQRGAHRRVVLRPAEVHARSAVVVLAWAVVAIGALLRLHRFVDNRSLWLDEAFLALNVREKSLADLLGPLDFLQSAAPGFLVLEKATVSVLGDSEYGLRAVSLASSLVALVLFRHVAGRLLPPLASLLALTLFAFNDALLYQAAEAKQYSLDVAVAVTLVFIYLVLSPGDDPMPPRHVFVLTGASVVGIFLSYTAIIVVASLSVALLVRAIRGHARGASIRALVAGGAVALAAFVGVYAISRDNVGRLSDAIFVDDGSGGTFAPLTGSVQLTWSIFVDPGGFQNSTNGVAAFLAVIAAVALALRRDLVRLAIVALPLALAFLASALDKYPLGNRYSLFLVPFILLLVAEGARELAASSRRTALVAAVLVVFLAGPAVAASFGEIAEPTKREDIKPLLRTLLASWEAGDTLFVYRNTQYALRYYSECADCSPSRFPWPTKIAAPSPDREQFAPALDSVLPAVVIGAQGGSDPDEQIERLSDGGRLWLLFSHVNSHSGLDERELIRRDLERRGGRLVAEHTAPGAWLYLYELPG